ncbi:retron St85 family RNA-directed DNA polymerase [Bradyrhizobium japonicum]|uniref:retron St85 family RNA-directed DNA polymerase n=1 Tax=Bradyrhizobium japonicum TaxID=375 RepID=UPI0027151CD4|nr:retron St85 family RNA-directed DNA polymerase [Bradyrhizobium japonicum]WLB53789.1 retron St85 family RNA-directed DNA polymerase [Bradyrhizobium japonicum]WLB64338.1 retron St85 family RNA-directed DNA polymerase [Bradyrhizobium japonicum]
MSRLLPMLISGTGLSEHDVLTIVRNAPVRYKTYPILKRNGGERLISQPARELKALQRVLVENFLSQLPVHPAATAYRAGVSIKDNAGAHAHNGPILKFDFKDFFPSITSRDWQAYCKQKSLFDEANDIWISTNIFFHRPPGSRSLRLAIGAPSSPSLSNVLMNDFDTQITEMVRRDKVTYTRYADDLTFSAKRTGFLTGVERGLRKKLREIDSPSLTLNPLKTVRATTKYKRVVTGLVLTNDKRVSLGHERKRRIRAALHYELHGKLTLQKRAELAGLLAFVRDVEPAFFTKLETKYGVDLIRGLKSAIVPRSMR